MDLLLFSLFLLPLTAATVILQARSGSSPRLSMQIWTSFLAGSSIWQPAIGELSGQTLAAGNLEGQTLLIGAIRGLPYVVVFAVLLAHSMSGRSMSSPLMIAVGVSGLTVGVILPLLLRLGPSQIMFTGRQLQIPDPVNPMLRTLAIGLGVLAVPLVHQFCLDRLAEPRRWLGLGAALLAGGGAHAMVVTLAGAALGGEGWPDGAGELTAAGLAGLVQWPLAWWALARRLARAPSMGGRAPGGNLWRPRNQSDWGAAAEGRPGGPEAQPSPSRMLHEIRRLIVRARDAESLLQQACRALVDIGPYTHSWIGLVDEDGQAVRQVAQAGFRQADLTGIAPVTQLGVAPQAAPHSLADRPMEELSRQLHSRASLQPWHAQAEAEGSRSFTCMRLRTEDAFVGVLAVYAPDRAHLTSEELATLGSVTRDLAYALDRIQQEQQRADELSTLRETSLSLTLGLDFHAVLNAILEHTLRLVHAKDAHIFLFDGQRLTFGAALWSDGASGEPFAQPREEGLTYAVARSGEQIVVSDASHHVLFESAPWSGAIVGLPLKIGSRVLGVMNVAFDRPHHFQPRELSILSLLADQAAVAIENATLFERTAAERRRVQLLYDITRELSSSLDPREIMHRAVGLTTEHLGGMLGTMNVLETGTQALHVHSLSGYEGGRLQELDRRVNMRLGKGFVGWIAKHQKPALSADVRQDGRWDPVPGVDDEVRSALGAPVIAGGELLGVLAIFHREVAFFDDEHLELMVAICQQVALAWSNAVRYRQVERRLAERTVIQQVAQVVNSRLEMGPLLDEVVNQVSQVLGYPIVDIVLVEGEELVLKAAKGFGRAEKKAVRIPLTEGVVGRVARTNRAAFLPDVQADPDYIALIPDVACEIAVPLRKGQVVIGVLNVESYEQGSLTEDDVRLLTLLADQVAIAIENAALYDRLRQHTLELESIVTERTAELAEALEKARQADRHKTQFVSDVSHELRTPLSNIRLYLELLAQSRPERRESYLDTLNRETDRLVALIEELLSISRLDAGSLQTRFELLDLNELAGALVDDRARLFAEKGLELDWRPEESVPHVLGDRRLVSQVIANLMTNALHYTRAGGQVCLETAVPKEGGGVSLSIQDTGLGIPAEERGRLFERFFRGSASREMGNPGTGLGLAICREIIERHQGSITVDSEVGQGSRFTLWLPTAEMFVEDAGNGIHSEASD